MYNIKDYYKILNVNIFADCNKIKKSYRELAMQYHPDRNPNNKDAEEKFKEITEAYEILSDKNKRLEYNIKYLFQNKVLLGGIVAGVALGIIIKNTKK